MMDEQAAKSKVVTEIVPMPLIEWLKNNRQHRAFIDSFEILSTHEKAPDLYSVHASPDKTSGVSVSYTMPGDTMIVVVT